MTAPDWASWMATKAVLQAAMAQPATPAAAQITQALNRADFALDGFKGTRLSFRPCQRRIFLTRSFYFTVPVIAAVLTFGSIANLNGAGSWDGVAAGFGCPQKIQEGEQANGSLYQIEYLPKGEKIGSHERIFTVTLTRLPKDEKEANEQADRSIKSIAASATRAAAKMNEFNRYSTDHGPVAFFDYVLKGEHNIGVIARTGPGLLTVYQLAILADKAPSEEDRKRVRSLIGLK